MYLPVGPYFEDMGGRQVKGRKAQVAAVAFTGLAIHVGYGVGQVVHGMAEMRQAHDQPGLRISRKYPAIINAVYILKGAAVELIATIPGSGRGGGRAGNCGRG